jgi:hypothetical protein
MILGLIVHESRGFMVRSGRLVSGGSPKLLTPLADKLFLFVEGNSTELPTIIYFLECLRSEEKSHSQVLCLALPINVFISLSSGGMS